MTHFDTFSGYGGFAIATERCGFKTIGFSEIDKYASAVLKYHWPNTKNYGDIKKINWSTIPDFDLLTGGSPCQDLSIAGHRKGLSGKRSGLFTEYIRCLKEKKPKYFIWENVKGALSSQNGWDFATVLTEMAKEGYSLWWQVLNAKDFGVPQNRERIFVVGFRDGSPREVFFESNTDKEGIKDISEESVQVWEKVRGDTVKYEDSKDSVDSYINENNWQNYVYNSSHRVLTPTENERLMGLPDKWTSKGIMNDKEVDVSDSQRYKLCGNGVVVNVVEELIRQLIR